MSETRKSVAIIGAGVSGLCSAKYAIENGLIPTIFEKGDKPGGLWNTSTMYDGLHLNSAKYSFVFHDFPWPDSTALLPTAVETLNYLLSYMNRFGLEKHLQLNTKVNYVKETEDKKWHIECVNLKTNQIDKQIFDFLLVCSGIYRNPRMPNFDNIENYKGLILHSSEYKTKDERLRNKEVIVVGHGCSATEMSSNLVGFASKIYNVFEKPYLISERLVRFKSSENDKLYQILPFDLYIRKRKHFYRDPLTPLTGQDLINKNIELFSTLCPQQTNKSISHPDLFYNVTGNDEIRFCIADNYYPYVELGKIIPKRGKIIKFEQDGILLKDGTFLKADAVILATGFLYNFDFLDEKILKNIDFDLENYRYQFLSYHYTFNPNYDNLAFIHFVKGVFIPETELQAEWANRVFSGKVALPDKQIMKDYIEGENKIKRNLYFQFPHGIFFCLSDNLARNANLMPDLDKLAKTDPELFDKLWNYPMANFHYYLHNRDANFNYMLNNLVDLEEKRYEFDNNEEFPRVYELALKMSKYYNIHLEPYKLKA
jgi:dimethylaniline monooxygenase (N-oxide forming)